jgi:hypothetical protein
VKPKKANEGLITKVGGWLREDMGKKAKEKKEAAAKKAAEKRVPEPQRMPIGTVHMVHQSGGFVLIQTSRTSEISPDADLLTYDLRGRPTGKLKLSPERKGAFLTADIVQGLPQANDRVVIFGYLDNQGQMRYDASDPTRGEALE